MGIGRGVPPPGVPTPRAAIARMARNPPSGRFHLIANPHTGKTRGRVLDGPARLWRVKKLDSPGAAIYHTHHRSPPMKSNRSGCKSFRSASSRSLRTAPPWPSSHECRRPWMKGANLRISRWNFAHAVAL